MNEVTYVEALAAQKGLTLQITKLENYLFELQVWDKETLIWNTRYTSVKRACADIANEMNNNFSEWV